MARGNVEQDRSEAALEVRQVELGSPEYRATVELRNQILRVPLGLELTPADLASDPSSYHLACFCKGDIVGCLLLFPRSDTEVAMRGVAVASNSQGQGVGRAMVEYSEQFALRHGFSLMTLDAREMAVPFYERLGYVKYGERFEKVTVPHWKMSKRLSSEHGA